MTMAMTPQNDPFHPRMVRQSMSADPPTSPNDEVTEMVNGFNTRRPRVATEPESAQVEVRRMLHTLRKRRVVVAVVSLLMAGPVAALVHVAGSRYEARAQILLQRQSVNVEGAERSAAEADRALRNEVLYIQSSVVRDAVTAALGREATIKVSSSAGGDLVTLKAQADDPAGAAAIANAYTDAYLQLRNTRLAAEADAIRDRIADVDRRIAAAATSADPAAVVERTRLEADGQDLAASLRDVERAIAGFGDTPQVVSRAEVPTSEASEGMARLIATFGVLGLLLGIGAAFAVEFFDRRILDVDDLARLTDVPTLSAVGGHSSNDAHFDAQLDAYQLLRFQLLARGSNNLHRLVAVMPVDRSGVAAVATMALGNECALAGADVLLVSASLGSSELALRVGLDDGRGLSTVLAGQDTIDSVVQAVPGSPRVSAIFAGPPIPGVARLSTKQGLSLVRSMQLRAEIVLVETPPIGTSDALDLGATAHEAVLVVTHKTSGDVVERAIASLRVSGVNLIAAVLVPKSRRAPRRGPAAAAVSQSNPLDPAGASNGPLDGSLGRPDAPAVPSAPAAADRGLAVARNGGGGTYPTRPRAHKGTYEFDRSTDGQDRSPSLHRPDVQAAGEPLLAAQSQRDADRAEPSPATPTRAQHGEAREPRSYYYLSSGPRRH
jgi:capsular polysaccharide biosynthesis protein/Mrp family chromosome partitioning ATPase